MDQQTLLNNLVFHWTGTLSDLGGTCLVKRELSHEAGAQGDAAEAQEEGAKAERNRGGEVEPGQGQETVAGTAREGEIGVGVESGEGDRGAREGNRGAEIDPSPEARRRRNLGRKRGSGRGEQRLTLVLLCPRS